VELENPKPRDENKIRDFLTNLLAAKSWLFDITNNLQK
jgi:hypothetical protein